MSGEVDIANVALGRITQATIASFDEDSAEAIEAKRLYPVARDHVLADFPWHVSTQTRKLTPLVNDRPDDYAYKYQRPKCLRVRHLLSETGKRDPRNPIKFEQSDGAIYADEPNARVVISILVEDTTLYSPALRSCIAWRLAYELVGPLQAGAGLMQWADRKYENEKADAEGVDAGEDTIVDDATKCGTPLPGPIAARE